MKQCPACQRTYAEDSLMYCLDDGTTLLIVNPSLYDPPPTVRIPEPRVTEQPQQPFIPPQQVYSQPGVNPAGFKVTNRMLGITGASIVLVGIFMPLISFMGFFGFSYLQIAQMRSEFFTAYLIPVLGIIALILSLKFNYRPLIAIGIAVLLVVILDYFRIKSAVNDLASAFPGAQSGMQRDPMAGQFLQSAVQISWGFFALIAGSVLLIVAGAKKDNASPNRTDWNQTSPPSIFK